MSALSDTEEKRRAEAAEASTLQEGNKLVGRQKPLQGTWTRTVKDSVAEHVDVWCKLQMPKEKIAFSCS